eukprot:scaffold181030_cov37-Cyclotella_meneghiniana.AAC.1
MEKPISINGLILIHIGKFISSPRFVKHTLALAGHIPLVRGSRVKLVFFFSLRTSKRLSLAPSDQHYKTRSVKPFLDPIWEHIVMPIRPIWAGNLREQPNQQFNGNSPQPNSYNHGHKNAFDTQLLPSSIASATTLRLVFSPVSGPLNSTTIASLHVGTTTTTTADATPSSPPLRPISRYIARSQPLNYIIWTESGAQGDFHKQEHAMKQQSTRDSMIW